MSFGLRLVFLTVLGGSLCGIGSAFAQVLDVPSAPPQSKPFALMAEGMDLLVEHSYFKPTRQQVLTEALDALRTTLGESSAPAFQSPRPKDLDGLMDYFTDTLLALANMPGATHTLRELEELALQGACRQIDQFSEYITAADYAISESDNRRGHMAVGLTIDQNLDTKEFTCYPLPAEPADLAGIRAGDLLIAVDGKATHGFNRHRVGSWLVGPGDSTVTLLIERDGERFEVPIKRKIVLTSPIEIREDSERVTVRIRKFNNNTVIDLKQVLARLEPGMDLVIDLRKCPGGEFAAGVAVAELFLPKDTPIAHLLTRTKEEDFLSQNPSPYIAGKILLLQDRGTASAAELLIAALTFNPEANAVSTGERSFGKATSQARFILKSGGVLKITDTRISGPGHQEWNAQGLPPTIAGVQPDAPVAGEGATGDRAAP